MNQDEIQLFLREMEGRIARLEHDLKEMGINTVIDQLTAASPIRDNSVTKEDKLYLALCKHSETLGNIYVQAKHEIEDTSRLTWVGTAHQIREVLSNLLRIMAPDSEVKKQEWYRQEKDSRGPTQKQRVMYILKQRDAGSNEEDVLKEIDQVNERVANLGRSIYSRASDAAHRSKELDEVKRILRYFEAFAYDLLDIRC